MLFEILYCNCNFVMVCGRKKYFEGCILTGGAILLGAETDERFLARSFARVFSAMSALSSASSSSCCTLRYLAKLTAAISSWKQECLWKKLQFLLVHCITQKWHLYNFFWSFYPSIMPVIDAECTCCENVLWANFTPFRETFKFCSGMERHLRSYLNR